MSDSQTIREQRFWAKVEKGSPDECWRWMGSVQNSGYGIVSVPPGNRQAHRFAYELSVGEIPEGLVIDHLCRNRLCVNPQHMEIVTQRENILRGVGISAQAARKTHCAKGHAYDEANTRTYVARSGHTRRDCRMCHRLRSRSLRQRAQHPTRPWRIEYRITDKHGNTSEWRRVLGSYSTSENAQKALDGNLGWYLSHAYKHETRVVEVLPAPRGDADA